MSLRRIAAGVLILLVVGACAPLVIPAGPQRAEPALLTGAVRVSDGAELPLQTWMPADGAPRAVVVALHGFNDYRAFFAAAGAWLATRGITSYAYDQRGFGRAPNRGVWPGTESLARDLVDVVSAVRRRHPETPIYVLGESMGGAVALVAVTERPAPLSVDGLILSAPAVWSRDTMPVLARGALWISAHTVPAYRATGRGFGVKASDNIAMLRALSKDPNVIKKTRIDAVYGLVGLMDDAQAAAPRLTTPTLILYGENDELVPPEPTRMFFTRLPGGGDASWRVALYADGYHMLLRDLEAERVWRDIAAWIDDPVAPLPSGAEPTAATPDACRRWNLCGAAPEPSPRP